MKDKNKKGYIITYENGQQKTFRFMHEIELCCELSNKEIVKALKTGDYVYDNVVQQKIWIEELA